MPRANRHPSSKARAFTLIELITVILIIVLVIAIVLPALAGVRDLSKKTATTEVVTQFATATTQFQQDKRRLPGYFTAREMGDAMNATNGLSGMENALIDLTGVPTATGPGAMSGAVQVNPTSDSTKVVKFVPDAMLAGKGAYFSPAGKYFVAQSAQGQATAYTNPAIPDLVDAWGTPLLFWAQDDMTIAPISRIGDVATGSFASATPSRFYMNSNICFINAPSLGAKGLNPGDTEKGSLLNATSAGNAPDTLTSLAGLVGSPSTPRPDDVKQTNNKSVLPGAMRGTFIVHSAGSNGMYLGKNELGAKSSGGVLTYGNNFTSSNGSLVTSSDILTGFDDIIQAGGN